MFRTLAIASLLALSACSSPQPTHHGANHPGNAAAPTAPAHEHAVHSPGVAGQHAAPAQVGHIYMCPMHPKVTSNNPEDRCPECGMKINQRINPENR